MKRETTLVMMALLTFLSASFAGAQTWVSINSRDPLPTGYVVGGLNNHGNALVVCRALGSNNLLTIGKTQLTAHNCKINVNGSREIINTTFDVLTQVSGGSWVSSADVSTACLASSGVSGGSDGVDPLFACQYDNGSTIQPGSLTADMTSCFGVSGGGTYQVSTGFKLLTTATCDCGQGTKCAFITSDYHIGYQLGGLSGADQICQTRADNAGLPGTYKAWLSTDTVSASSRLAHSSDPYHRTDGVKIANNWTDLTDGALIAAINVTESQGTVPLGNIGIWTNTDSDGSIAGSHHCGGWNTNLIHRVTYGKYNAVDTTWANVGTAHCSARAYLHCFQQ